MKENLQFVCHEVISPMDWYYDSSDQKYIRFDGKEITRTITGKNLPNPFLLWQSRVSKGRNKESAKPQDVTFKLFEHWQKVSQNADANN